MTAHLTIGCEMQGREIEALLSRIKRFLRDRWTIDHATIEPEIGECTCPQLLGRWRART